MSILKLELLGTLNIRRLGSLNRVTAKQGSDEASRSLKKLLVPNLPRKKILHGPDAVFESAQKRDSPSIKSPSSIREELVRERIESSRKRAVARPRLRSSDQGNMSRSVTYQKRLGRK